jgi:hypothetical protein
MLVDNGANVNYTVEVRSVRTCMSVCSDREIEMKRNDRLTEQREEDKVGEGEDADAMSMYHTRNVNIILCYVLCVVFHVLCDRLGGLVCAHSSCSVWAQRSSDSPT